MRRAPSSRIGAGPVGAIKKPSPASELLRKGGDKACAAPLHREPVRLQDALYRPDRAHRYPVGADEGQRWDRDLRKHSGERRACHQVDTAAIKLDGLTKGRCSDLAA